MALSYVFSLIFVSFVRDLYLLSQNDDCSLKIYVENLYLGIRFEFLEFFCEEHEERWQNIL